ncbi:MAG: CpaF family protein [Bryobacterales bacterium]|nr:CpaF family protein [Bryobacterales bacterium]
MGDEVGEEKPLLDSRLPDGSRVAAVFPPCSVTGTILTIRKFQSKLYTTEELVRLGSLAPEALAILRNAVESRQNILISGGTGTGKTTLLTALSAFIPQTDRIVVIEDTSEIQIETENLVRLESRREQPGLPAITIRDLLRTTLRLRPDRILLGEVRGGEAFDLLQALNTGHSGTLRDDPRELSRAGSVTPDHLRPPVRRRTPVPRHPQPDRGDPESDCPPRAPPRKAVCRRDPRHRRVRSHGGPVSASIAL